MEERGVHSLKTQSPSHASKPRIQCAHTTHFIDGKVFVTSDVCGEAVTLTERDGSQDPAPLHCRGGLQRTKAQSPGRGGFTPGILKLRRPKSEGLWQGPGQTRRLSQKMKTKVGVVPHIWEILELPPTLNVSLEPASLPPRSSPGLGPHTPL